MAVAEIHHVVISGSKLEKAVEFYETALGYRKTLHGMVGPTNAASLGLPEDTKGRAQFLQGPSQIGQLELIEWEGEPGEQARSSHTDLGPYVLCFEVPRDEIDAVHERITSLGAFCQGAPGPVHVDNYGYITAFSALDPDGNRLSFISTPSREEVRAYRARNQA
jgi:catechol 2,3-dioxygenase-like lactoylglutathione lyase family enzyme